MLFLPTEATIEAMNVCTNRRHPFHTYNNHGRFRQCGFIQQNIVVNIDDVERDTEVSNGKESLRQYMRLHTHDFKANQGNFYHATHTENSFLESCIAVRFRALFHEHQQTAKIFSLFFLFLFFLNSPCRRHCCNGNCFRRRTGQRTCYQ